MREIRDGETCLCLWKPKVEEAWSQVAGRPSWSLKDLPLAGDCDSWRRSNSRRRLLEVKIVKSDPCFRFCSRLPPFIFSSKPHTHITSNQSLPYSSSAVEESALSFLNIKPQRKANAWKTSGIFWGLDNLPRILSSIMISSFAFAFFGKSRRRKR